jgi:uncharacterized protein
MRKSTKKQPLKFFLLVFAISIPFWVIDTMIHVKTSLMDFSIIDILAAFIPITVASILVYQEEGYVGIKTLFKRIFDFAIVTKKSWYLPIIFLPFFMYFLIYFIILVSGLPHSHTLNIPLKSIPFLFLSFFIGAVCEETGYMGYAIEPMQSRFSALKASILVGIPWAVWHYPSIIQQGHGAVWIAWATIGTIAVRVLIVWIFNNTQKSLFACILFHTMMNLGRPLFPKDKIHNPLVDYPEIHYSLIAVVAVIVVLLWDAKTLAKFRFRSKKYSKNTQMPF